MTASTLGSSSTTRMVRISGDVSPKSNRKSAVVSRWNVPYIESKHSETGDAPSSRRCRIALNTFGSHPCAATGVNKEKGLCCHGEPTRAARYRLLRRVLAKIYRERPQ